MRILALLALLIVLPTCTLAADLTGTYKGTWSSDNEGRGDLTMTFSSGDSGTLNAQVSFTNEGETIACDVKSATFDGSKLVLVINFQGGDDKFEATLSGTLDGRTLSGTYKNKSLTSDSPGDTGTWKATI